jgi:hypothetical protein
MPTRDISRGDPLARHSFTLEQCAKPVRQKPFRRGEVASNSSGAESPDFAAACPGAWIEPPRWQHTRLPGHTTQFLSPWIP